jgi:hypothetical protein
VGGVAQELSLSRGRRRLAVPVAGGPRRFAMLVEEGLRHSGVRKDGIGGEGRGRLVEHLLLAWRRPGA